MKMKKEYTKKKKDNQKSTKSKCKNIIKTEKKK